MWEAQAADGRLDDLVDYVSRHADPAAEVYRSADDRVVVIDPTGRGLAESRPISSPARRTCGPSSGSRAERVARWRQTRAQCTSWRLNRPATTPRAERAGTRPDAAGPPAGPAGLPVGRGPLRPPRSAHRPQRGRGRPLRRAGDRRGAVAVHRRGRAGQLPAAALLRRRRTADVATPILLIPPLMMTTEVWDVSPSTSAVAALHEAGIDPWVVDFGHPDQRARRPGAQPDRPRAGRQRRRRPGQRGHRPRRRRSPATRRAACSPTRPRPTAAARTSTRWSPSARRSTPPRRCRSRSPPTSWPGWPANSSTAGCCARSRCRAGSCALGFKMLDPAKIAAGPGAVPARPARPRRAAAARAAAPLPRLRGLDGVLRPGHRRAARAVRHAQPDARGRLRHRRPARHARRHRRPGAHLRRRDATRSATPTPSARSAAPPRRPRSTR